VQLSSAREAEKRWRCSSVEGIAGRKFLPAVGEGRTGMREAAESPLLEVVARKRLVKT
jgi:hypothetical protein